MHPPEDVVPPDVLFWVERCVGAGSRAVHCRQLVGGITSAVHTVDVEYAGQVQQLVLKRWIQGEADERRHWIDREAKVLQELETAGVPAPRYVASTDGSETGDVPALLMTRLPGQTWLTPTDPRSWLRQIASTLARLHDLPPPVDLPIAELNRGPVVTPPDSQLPLLWDHVADTLSRPAPAGTSLIHGDYQHFNLLWEHERLTGVVDWTWTGVGHPDRDVGHCRLNLAVLFTSEWAADFADAYEAEAGRATDPWWNAFELSRYGSDDWKEFIPIQVAGRVAVDTLGMTARVEDQLRRLIS